MATKRHEKLNEEQKAACQQLREALELCFYHLGLDDERIKTVIQDTRGSWLDGRITGATKTKMQAFAARMGFERALDCENNTEGNIQHTCAACAGK
jgi:hypothetical protein